MTADRINHMERCDRSAPIVATMRRDATGRGWGCQACTGCGRTDVDALLVDALLADEDEHRPGGRGEA